MSQKRKDQKARTDAVGSNHHPKSGDIDLKNQEILDSIDIDGTLYAKTTRGYIKKGPGIQSRVQTLSTATLEPLSRIEFPDGESIEAEILGKTVIIPRKAWNSSREFLNIIQSCDFHWFGNDQDVQKVLFFIMDRNPHLPRKRGVLTIGRHESFFVLPQGVLDKDGWITDPPIVYVPNGNNLEKLIHVTKEPHPEKLIQTVYENLHHMNTPTTIYPLIGMKFAQSFAPLLRQALGHFPIIYGYGDTGSGKTTTATLMWRLQGIHADLFGSSKTKFTFTKLGSSTNAIGVPLDEIKGDLTDLEIGSLKRFMRHIYDGQTDERGRQDLSVTQYALESPIEVYGEIKLQEGAISERIIPVGFEGRAVSDVFHKKAYANLVEKNLEAFPRLYVPWTLGVDFDEELEVSRSILSDLIPTQDIPNRIKDNILTVVFGLRMYEKFGQSWGITIDREIDLEKIVSHLKDEILSKSGKTRLAFDYFIEQLAVMALREKIKFKREYDVDYKKRMLFVHVPSCYAAFRQFARETSYQGEILDEDSYYRQANAEAKAGGYVLKVSAGRRYPNAKGEAPKRSVIIDMDRFLFDLSGFDVHPFNDDKGSTDGSDMGQHVSE